jgi:pantothenate kinase type III
LDAVTDAVPNVKEFKRHSVSVSGKFEPMATKGAGVRKATPNTALGQTASTVGCFEYCNVPSEVGSDVWMNEVAVDEANNVT